MLMIQMLSQKHKYRKNFGKNTVEISKSRKSKVKSKLLIKYQKYKKKNET